MRKVSEKVLTLLREGGPINIDLGCGNTPATKKDYIGFDIIDFGQDIVWDIADGIPLPDNSVDLIYSSHFVEHVPAEHINTLIREMIRVCKHGATVKIACPHSDTIEAYYLCHVSLWDERRVKGILADIRYQYPGHFKLMNTERAGIEFRFTMTVVKNNIRK
jgi:predicted SAM-dependent methyltransferase